MKYKSDWRKFWKSENMYWNEIQICFPEILQIWKGEFFFQFLHLQTLHFLVVRLAGSLHHLQSGPDLSPVDPPLPYKVDPVICMLKWSTNLLANGRWCHLIERNFGNQKMCIWQNYKSDFRNTANLKGINIISSGFILLVFFSTYISKKWVEMNCN